MKHKLLLFSIITACLFIQRQACAQYPLKDTARLKQAYRELKANPASPKNQMIFFKLFPSTWMEFKYLYEKTPLYQDNGGHLEAFKQLFGSIPDSLYFDKVISISVGGIWNADAVNFFQYHVHHITLKKPKTMLERLSKQTKGYQLRFWQFYWTSLPANYRSKEKYDELRAILFAISPQVTEIMDIGFEYAWKEYFFQDGHPKFNHEIENIK
jgi:hypothetical protein